MKNLSKKLAFTLAEIMIAVLISAVIAVLFLKAIRTGTNHYSNNLMSYSALNSLSAAAYDMAQTGCTTAGGTSNDMTAAASITPALTPAHPYCDAATGLLPRWNHTDSSTVTTPATMPNRGFCDRFAREEINVAGVIDCTQSANDSTNFTTATPNFTSTNGARFFNFGATLVSQTTAKTASDYYTVYIDIDGKKRSGRLTESATGKKDVDVIKFYVSMDGNTVVPDPNSIAANDTDYLTASVKYLSGTNYIYPLTGVNYRKALCATNPTLSFVVGGTTINYCAGQTTYTTSYNPRPADVSACGTNTCDFELDEPGILGLRNIFNTDHSNN